MREKILGENHKERENQEKRMSATKSALFCLASVPELKSPGKMPHRNYEESPGGGGDGTSSEGAGVDVGGEVLCRVACQR